MKADATIKADVLTELRYDPSVNHDKIEVIVEDGIVSLLGSVPTFEEKKSAEAAVQRVVGVKAVVEGLEILSPESIVADDVNLAKAIIDQFHWSIHLPGPSIKVKVEKGWVTLSGDVDRKPQYKMAENIVRSMEGVIGVTNNIYIRQKDIKPEAVRKKINESLKHAVEEDTKDIKIKVDGNKAILEGEVHSFKDMFSVREAALKTPGITSVENNLVVD